MRNRILAAAAAATIFTAVPAFAQDTAGPADAGTPAPAPASEMTAPDTAPDGTKGFGFEPYVAVRGGWEQFDSEATKSGVTRVPRSDKLNGAIVEGIVGANIPLNAFFIGAEGNVAKGVSGDIDWEYGVAGRFGVRAGDSGLFYGKVGYQWVNFDKRADTSRDFHDVTYGVGFEVGPKDIGLGGITGNSGLRLRGELTSFGWINSFRPTLGVVAHF